MSHTSIFPVTNVRKGDPGNSLPKWVRNIARTRGYGDAAATLSNLVTDAEIDKAFEEKAHGNGDACVLAQMTARMGARQAYFYRHTAWVDFGSGPLVYFVSTPKTFESVIKPFDDGDRANTLPGTYDLKPPAPSRALGQAMRRRDKGGYERRKSKNPTERPPADFSRVVQASQVGKTLVEKVLG